MKKLVILAAIIMLASANAAYASSITIKFGGGCHAENTTTNCLIKASSNLADGTGLNLYHGATRTGPFRKVTTHARTLSGGAASFSSRNQTGCWQVRTANNGNDQPDTRSNTKCE